jgi:transposase
MRSKAERQSEEAERAVRDIRRTTRRQYSAEEEVRIVIAGLRGEDSIAELCRKEGINQNLYYRWIEGGQEAGGRYRARGVFQAAGRRSTRGSIRRATS